MLVAVILTLLSGIVSLAFLAYERFELENGGLKHIELISKVLEGQTTRELDVAANLLRSIPEVLDGRNAPLRANEINTRLRDSLRNQPLIRSISILDASDAVLSSSDPDVQGKVVRLENLGFPTLRTEVTRLGSLLFGRGLSDVSTSRSAYASTVLPMGLKFRASNGRELLLVALLNLDYFGNQHELIVNDASIHAVIMSLDGRLLTTDTHIQRESGENIAGLPFLNPETASQEFGRSIGQGLNDQRVLSSFRASTQWPLVLFVEQDYQAATADLYHLAQSVGLMQLFIWGVIFTATTLILKAQKTEERASAVLAKTTREVAVSEARKSAILSSSLDCLITTDKAGHIVDFNPAAERTFGHRAVDVINQHVITLIIPQGMRAKYFQAMDSYLRTGSNPDVGRIIEVEAIRADGQHFQAEMAVTEFKAGNEPMFVLSARDISERKAAEAERNALLRRYQLMATALERRSLALDQHAILSISDANGIITHANSKLCLVSGYTADELLGRMHTLVQRGEGHGTLARTAPLPQAWTSECSAPIRQDILHHIDQGLIWEGELLHHRKNGTSFWTAATIVPMQSQDKELEQVFVIETDITSRIKAERAVAEAREIELQIGSRIQQTLLVPPADQRLPKTWLSTYTRASQGIDGDFFEVLCVGDDCVDIIAGDVMGKGVGAALIGAATKMQLRHCLAELTTRLSLEGTLPQPAQMMRALHRVMFPSLQALDAFVTLTYVRIDTKSDTVSWVGCGHEEPLLIRQDGSSVFLENQYPPLGVLESDDYEQESVPMTAGDGLFICSDGVTDAIRSDGTRLGRPAVRAHIEAALRELHTPATVLHTLRRQLLGEDVRITDDLTMIMAMRTVATVDASRRELSFSLNDLNHVRGLVEARASTTSMTDDEVSLFTVACVEAFTNIVRHANGQYDDESIELVVKRESRRLIVEFVYIADAFEPPQEFQVTDFGLYPEGGFGLTIMQQASAQLDHEHQNGVNTIRLIKHCQCEI